MNSQIFPEKDVIYFSALGIKPFAAKALYLVALRLSMRLGVEDIV